MLKEDWQLNDIVLPEHMNEIGKTVNDINSRFDGDGAANNAVKLKELINITIGDNAKEFDGSKDISFTLDEIGVYSKSHIDKLNTKFLEYAMENGYNGIVVDGSSNAWIRTTENGLLPFNSKANNNDTAISSIGSETWPFAKIYGETIYEGDTPLSNKYLSLTGGIVTGQTIFKTTTMFNGIRGEEINPSTQLSYWSISNDGHVACSGLYVNGNTLLQGGEFRVQVPMDGYKTDGTKSWGIDRDGNITVNGMGTIGGLLNVKNGAINGMNNIQLNRGNVYIPIFAGNVLSDYLKAGGGYILCTDGGAFCFIKNGATSNTIITNGELPLAHANNANTLTDYIRLGNGVIACPSSGTVHMQTAGGAKTTLYVGDIINTYSISNSITKSNKSVFDDINNVDVIETKEGYRLTKGIENNIITEPIINEKTGEEEVNVNLNSVIATLWKSNQELIKENEALKDRLNKIEEKLAI